jgi:hypothetical protein
MFFGGLEVHDGADRDARAIGGAPGIVEADVVELRSQSQVRQNANINAAAKTIGEVGGRAAAVARGQMAGTCQELNKGSDLGWVVHDDARAEQEGVGVERNAARRGVVAAEVADDTEEGDGLVSDRAADAILIDAAGIAQTEVGVADGGVDGGLGARRKGEQQQSQAEYEQAFHRNRSFRELLRVELRSQSSSVRAGWGPTPTAE